MAQTQEERRLWLIRHLLAELEDGAKVAIPDDAEGQRGLLRALMNIRPPEPVSDEFLTVQDAYLQGRLADRGAVELSDLSPVPNAPQLRLWRGDITRLAVDAIVNAANSQMLGCFRPGHHCIDNAIHTFAGVQLRLECDRIMQARGRLEPTATATITAARGPCHPHRRTHSPRASHRTPPRRARPLLSQLPGLRAGARAFLHCLLLHLHRRVWVPAGRSCAYCRRHGQGVACLVGLWHDGRVQRVPRDRPAHL